MYGNVGTLEYKKSPREVGMHVLRCKNIHHGFTQNKLQLNKGKKFHWSLMHRKKETLYISQRYKNKTMAIFASPSHCFNYFANKDELSLNVATFASIDTRHYKTFVYDSYGFICNLNKMCVLNKLL